MTRLEAMRWAAERILSPGHTHVFVDFDADFGNECDSCGHLITEDHALWCDECSVVWCADCARR